MEENNTKERVARLEASIEHIEKALVSIDNHLTNHIPTKIDGLRRDLCDELKSLERDLAKYKLAQARWVIGILVLLVGNLIVTIISLTS